MRPSRALPAALLAGLLALPLASCKHDSPVVGICLGSVGNSCEPEVPSE